MGLIHNCDWETSSLHQHQPSPCWFSTITASLRKCCTFTSPVTWDRRQGHTRPLAPVSHASTYWWRSVILFCRFCSSSPVSPSNLAIINKVTKPQRKCEDISSAASQLTRQEGDHSSHGVWNLRAVTQGDGL